MAQRGVPAGRDSPADRPSILQITVEATPRRPPSVRPAHVLIAIAVLGVIGAALAIAVLQGGAPRTAPLPSTARSAPTPHEPTVLVDSGPPSGTGAGVYRFPVGCPYTRVTAVERNRIGPCSPHDGLLTAVVRRVGGVWRVTLEPTGASCLQRPVPPLARGKVKACGR
jgi:hypothetical protein